MHRRYLSCTISRCAEIPRPFNSSKSQSPHRSSSSDFDFSKPTDKQKKKKAFKPCDYFKLNAVSSQNRFEKSFKLDAISSKDRFQNANSLDSERKPARERKISRESFRIAHATSYKLLRDVRSSETTIEGGKGSRVSKVLLQKHETMAMKPNEQKTFVMADLDKGSRDSKVLRQKHEARVMMSSEQKTFGMADLGLSDEDNQSLSFAPGTFIEARRNEETVQGIVLSEAIIDRQWNLFTLKPSGEVYIHLRTDVHFAVPNLISANLAERCGKDPITTSALELNARVEALKHLREITLAAEHAANGSNVAERERNINVYNLVRSREPRKWSKTTVSEVTEMLYKNPSFLEYFGTHTFLMDNSLNYVADQNYLTTHTFNVRPIEDVEEIQTVLKWIMDYRQSGHNSGYYSQFIKKARSLIKAYDNDKTRRDSGPMTQEPAKHTWTEHDKVILGFLLRSLHLHRSIQTNTYALGRSTILKHLYPAQDVSDSITHETLIKLGVLAPWQDLLVLLPEFDIDLEPEATSPRAIAEKALVERSYSTAGSMAGQVLGPEEFLDIDPLDSVRHDFSNDRVFVIDDVGAEELDDGCSLERIPSEPDNHWIHVHIADPAHLLHPGHALCHQARKRGSTLYFLQKSYPLFPSALMHHPTRGLSLGSDSLNGSPNKVITFSIKVDRNANILDYNVRAGLIRNIKKTTYDTVDKALGVPPPVIGYPFGPPHETPPSAPPFNKQDLNDLQILYQLANDQVQKRFREDRISFTMENAKLERMSLDPNIRSPTMEASVFNGFPELSYSVGGAIVDDVGSRSMISEMMKLACRIASRFALDRNVPILRRGTDAIMASTEVAFEEILAQRSPHSYVPLHTNLERIAITPPAAFSLEPKEHHPLAIPEGEGYSRATSPLRRFDDLVVHWQLHHALLGSKAPSRPPFDVDALEKYIPELSATDRRIRNGHARNINFFVLMFLKRWMDATAKGAERPFGNPLTSMTAYTFSMVQDTFMGSYGCHVHIPELGVKAHLVGLAPTTSFPLSTKLKVKATHIELGIQRSKLVVKLLE